MKYHTQLNCMSFEQQQLHTFTAHQIESPHTNHKNHKF